MIIGKYIYFRKDEFKALCRNHQVRFMFAFGSAVTDHFNEEFSDIDLLVEIDEKDPLSRGEILISLWDKLETFFNRKVDLLTYSSIKNPYLHKSIDATKVLIYEGKGQEVLT